MSKFLLFLLLASFHSGACDELYSNLSDKVTHNLEAVSLINRSEKVIFESHSKSIIGRTGLPKEGLYRIFKADDSHIFRHYTEVEALKSIVKSKKLVAGHKSSYLMSQGGEAIHYEDLTGVFMTRPEYEAGNGSQMHYIDFRLPKDMPVLELKEMGSREYIVLGARTWQPWLIKEIQARPEKYENFLKYFDSQVINGENHLVPKAAPLEVPVEIVGSSLPQVWSQEIGKIKDDLALKFHLPQHFVESYYQKRIEPYLSKVRYKASDRTTEVSELYRGMLLSISELQNILTNGMSLDKVSWNAGGVGISFSSEIQEAVSYIFQSYKAKSENIGVVFKVRKNHEFKSLDDLELDPGETIFKTQKTIKPQDIMDIYIMGEYGLESINYIFENISRIKPHVEWTNQFLRGISR